ncbi:translation initiation factor [Candidatus Woesearchaeota archaeon]|nr:translation initiation factor [Candidatus Woesearchaeota archaeon]
MIDICKICGLKKDLCVCEEIAKEEQKIRIKVEKIKFGKMMTIVQGINAKDIDLKEITKGLKSKLACGGTLKDNVVELQGSHAERVKAELIKLGFNKESISIE